MKKFLFLAIAVFLITMSIETLGFNYNIGDHHYYTINGTGVFGDGHDLTLLISKPLSVLGDFTLPLFFNFIFAFSIYFLLKSFPKIKYPEWAFLLAPITPLASIYAQIFAIALFNIGLGFYFRNKHKLVPLFLVLVFLAHYWSGLFIAGIFILYLLLFDRNPQTRRWCLLPTMTIILFFTSIFGKNLAFFSNIGDLKSWSAAGVVGMTVFDFLKLFSRNFVFFELAVVGACFLYIKKIKNFLALNMLLFVVPLFTIVVFSNSIYWNWRMAYFMPLTVLTTVLFSWLRER